MLKAFKNPETWIYFGGEGNDNERMYQAAVAFTKAKRLLVFNKDLFYIQPDIINLRITLIKVGECEV